MRIVVDAMGSDQYPQPDVAGAVLAAREYGIEIILVGNEQVVGPALAAQKPGNLPIRLVHAPDMLTMADKGMAMVLKAKRRNAQNSMAVGIDLVKQGEADAFVTAGNTGAASMTAYFRLGTLPGVERPALAPAFPVRNGRCVVLDIGATPDCKPEYLLQFAILGCTYAERARGIPRPRLGLLSNGEEAGKGNQLVKDTYPLLEKSGLNFIGNVEGKEIFDGQADVVVTDGFTGNVFLKAAEASAGLLIRTLRDQLQAASLPVKLGALLVKPTLTALRQLLDPSAEGAAPLLGVNGLVFIGHGRSDARAIKNAVQAARQAVTARVLDNLRAQITAALSNQAPSTRLSAGGN